MKNNIACDQNAFISKLREMNFSGPIEIAGRKFMLYHGRVIAALNEQEFTIAQFRFLIHEVQKIASTEEWQH